MTGSASQFDVLMNTALFVLEQRIQDTSIHKDMLSKADYLREYATLHLNVGRQIGKSTWIHENASPNSCVLVHHPDAVMQFPNVPAYTYPEARKNINYSPLQLIVDEPLHTLGCTRKQDFYEWAAGLNVRRVIMLGE